MAGFSKAMVLGNVTAKPELKYTSSGIPFCSFTVAANEKWGTGEDGEKKEHVEWNRCTAWRKTAEICAQYLDKGKQVFIEGKIRTRSYEKDGEKRYATEIVVDQMTMLGGGRGREDDEEQPYSAPAQAAGGFGSDRRKPAETQEVIDLDKLDDMEREFF